MKLGAIDIGSNAIRLQITIVLEMEDGPVFKKLEYIRFPLRLGLDVFHTGKISDYNKARFLKLMHAFKNLIDLYELDGFLGCATSAMREAENGQEILDEAWNEFGLKIEIIEGKAEAEMINNAILEHLDKKTYLHIDVGGGSTELNIYKSGKKVDAASFKIGSVRRLSKLDADSDWKLMRKWIHENPNLKKSRIYAVGTGGNINKYFGLSGKKSGRTLTLKMLEELKIMVENMSIKDRIHQLRLNEDRADVIVPAAEIYITVMKWSNSRSILVPNVGLKDGIMKKLYGEVGKRL